MLSHQESTTSTTVVSSGAVQRTTGLRFLAMTYQPVYIDPGRRLERLSLLGELTKLPSKPAFVPAEDQLTAALAWLADHSDHFARALCTLMLDEADEGGRDAVARSAVLGAAVQVRLPSIGAGFLWADLSIAGSERTFQLLVEVKLTSDFHTYDAAGVGTLAQPEAYLHSWRSCAPDEEASVRRLGTLTLDGHAPEHSDDWRARDVTWTDVHQLLVGITDELRPEVRLVADDLRDYLAGRVLAPVIAHGFLDRGGTLARGICDHLRPRVVEGKITGTFQPNEKSHYVGGYLQFTAPEGTREKLWFVVTPAGGDYNVPGAPSSIQITSVNDDPPTATGKARLLEAGFAQSKDKAGYTLLRAALPLDELQNEPLGDQITVAAEWASGLLEAAGFVASP
jgi:hypothetical protein